MTPTQTVPTIEILENKDALIGRTYQVVVKHLKDAIAQRGKATIALSGGSTPKPLYRALQNADLPWDKIYVFWGDERYVPHDHPRSNAGMANEALLNHVPIPAENVYPMPTDSDDPVIDAAKYNETLNQFFDTASGNRAAIDVVLQGMGDDGHTASLFPHTEALDVRDRLVTVGNHDGEPRITFTIPMINQGRNVLFLVAGENKQDALAHVFSEDAKPHDYPSKFIQPLTGAHWLMDEPAGQGVPEKLK